MAVMLCVPGFAEAGMVIDPVSVPVAVLTSRSVSVVSKYTSTASLLEKPLPLMVTVCVGCPLTGAGVMTLAAAARRTMKTEAIETARIRVNICNVPVSSAATMHMHPKPSKSVSSFLLSPQAPVRLP